MLRCCVLDHLTSTQQQSATGGNVVPEARTFLSLHIGERHKRTFLHKAARGAGADSTCRADDKSNLVVENAHHHFFFADLMHEKGPVCPPYQSAESSGL